MKVIFCTDGDANDIVVGVGLTIERFTIPEDDDSSFGNLESGYKRQMFVDPASLEGLLSGAGAIGYFSEAALGKSRPGKTVPLLVELIAAGNRKDVVVPPLFWNSAGSIAGEVPPRQLSLEEQHALFVRVLGKNWPELVSKLDAQRKAEKCDH
jgi:hypothetical protein